MEFKGFCFVLYAHILYVIRRFMAKNSGLKLLYSSELAEMGVVIHKFQNSAGGTKPHIAVRFRSARGKVLTFAVDMSRLPKNGPGPDAYLITHAHSDHYGMSAMLSDRSWCSVETGKALEIRHGRKFMGSSFNIGDVAWINDVPVRTFPVFHTAGSTSYFWTNEQGVRILVTGDVKDASFLPKCDILIMEASYGDPDDLSCYFRDDPSRIQKVVLENIGVKKVAFGAYDFGKAQKTVELLRNFGYTGPITMNKITYALTNQFVNNAGHIVPCIIGKHSSVRELADVSILPPNTLSRIGAGFKKYVLTCRNDYPYPTIRFSDHLDVRGLTEMVRKCSPKITVVYHPNTGLRPQKFAQYLRSLGCCAFSLSEIETTVKF